MSAIADQLRRARRRQGLTQRQLAKRVGTTQSMVSEVERGVVGLRVSTLERWAAELGLSVVLLPDAALEPVDEGEGGEGR